MNHIQQMELLFIIVSRSVMPVKGEEKMTKDIYGQRSNDLLAYYDPNTSCWRMFQVSNPSTEDKSLGKFSETWPRSGMVSNGNAFQRASLVPLTGGTGSGLLHTRKKVEKMWDSPSCSEEQQTPFGKFHTPKTSDAPGRDMYKNSRGEPQLSGQVRLYPEDKLPETQQQKQDAKLWRTPAAQESGVDVENLETKSEEFPKRGERAYDKDSGRLAQVGLEQQVKMEKNWPTPMAEDYRRRGPGSKQQGLPERVRKEWPTPRSNEVQVVSENLAQRNKGNLEEEVSKEIWPTPRAGNPGSRKSGTGGKVLAEEAKKRELWRTPTVEGEAGKRGLGNATCEELKAKNRTISLTRQVRDEEKEWPTPQARDVKDTGNPEKLAKAGEDYQTSVAREVAKRDIQDKGAMFKEQWMTPDKSSGERGWRSKESIETKDSQLTINDQVRHSSGVGQLNPEWVEVLMGFPPRWTEA